MGARSLLRDSWELIPILLLLVIGGGIALQSGVRKLAFPDGARQVAGNLTKIVLRLLAYVVVIMLLQYSIGLRPHLGW
jgi:hypothetical protein